MYAVSISLMQKVLMKIYDASMPKPPYLVAHKKVHDAVALLLCFVVCPIISISMIAGGGANLVTTSISKLGWQNGMLPAVYFWGLINIAVFVYLLKLSLDSGCYTRKVKIFFYALTAASCLFLLIGISVPFISDDIYQHYVMRKIHNVFATAGFVMFVVVLIALALCTVKRNSLQATINLSLLAFLIITGIFAVLCVNSPEKATFITAAAQMYIFVMLHILLVSHYFLNAFLPLKSVPKNLD